MDEASELVQKGRHTFLKMMLSFPDGVVLSPQQVDFAIYRYLYHLSAAAYVTVPNRPDKKTAKNQRQRLCDLRDQLGQFTVHNNTNNLHIHGDLSTVDCLTSQVIVINDGLWKIASEYARQETMLDLGMLPLGHVPRYVLDKVDGPVRVVDTMDRVIAKAATQSPAKPTWIDHGWVPLPKTEAQYHRGRPHPGYAFQGVMAEAFPNGLPQRPPRVPHVSGMDPTEYTRLLDEREALQKRNRADLAALLTKNNMCITPGRKSGLVLCVNRDRVPMREVSKGWTRPWLGTFAGLQGGWELGLSAEQQSVAPDHDRSIEFMTARMVQAKETFPKWYDETLFPFLLPWTEYCVEIRQINGQTLRPGRMKLAELKTLADTYLESACDGTVAKTVDEAQPGTVPACTLTLRPNCLPGEMLLAIHRIPLARIDEFKDRFDPSLILRVGDGYFTGVLILQYAMAQRWESRNARARLADDIVREFGAEHWSDGFPMPEVPALLRRGWVFPRIVRIPHLRVCEPAQELLAQAWVQLMAEEKDWWINVAKISELRKGVAPGSITKNLENKLWRVPLRRGNPTTPGDIKTISAPVPTLKESKQAKTEEEEDRETKIELPSSPLPVPPRVGEDDEEEKKKKRRLQEGQTRDINPQGRTR
jgi:hypothetical protein